MVVLDTDGILDLDDLPPELMEDGDRKLLAEQPEKPALASNLIAAGNDSSLLGRTMDEIERWAIEETLKLTAGNREEAARVLAIGARTLYRKLDKYRSDAGSLSGDSEHQETESA
jgi:two-component system response regulator HydG